MADLYDEAILKKFTAWTENTKVHLYGPNDIEQLVKVNADETKDKRLALPIISVSRVPGYKITNVNKIPLTYDGKMLESDESTSISLNAIPIEITYQVDVWTRYRSEADEYMRNLVFNMVNFPILTVQIPYSGYSVEHNAKIKIVTDPFDNSQQLKLATDQFTRLAIGINIDDAYLWDTRIRDNISIDFDDLDIGSNDN